LALKKQRKTRHATSREKALNIAIYDSRFFLKGNYEYDHNSIRIDTEQDGFL